MGHTSSPTFGARRTTRPWITGLPSQTTTLTRANRGLKTPTRNPGSRAGTPFQHILNQARCPPTNRLAIITANETIQTVKEHPTRICPINRSLFYGFVYDNSHHLLDSNFDGICTREIFVTRRIKMKAFYVTLAASALAMTAPAVAHESTSGTTSTETPAPKKPFSETTADHTKKPLQHSGGTDSQGCHTNHSTGVYHCHNPK